MQYIGSLEAAEKHNSAKSFKENLHTSVKFLQICMDLQDSVQRSLQNPVDQHRFAKIENLGILDKNFSEGYESFKTGVIQKNSQIFTQTALVAFLTDFEIRRCVC